MPDNSKTFLLNQSVGMKDIKFLHQHIAALEAENKKLRDALKFYARHEHWMALADSADTPETVLIAMQGDNTNGWGVAEDALKEPRT